MEGLECDLFLFTLEQIHHNLEVVRIGDVFGHYLEIMSVQEQFSEELQ